MPHLNELNEQYASKGLTVLALTSEGTGPTEKWIEENGAKYAYAYDKGGALSRELGVSGIPNAVLVNPAGKVVWQGGPTGLRGDMIEEHLKGALATPIYELPSEASGVAKALKRRQFSKAIDEAASLQGPELKEALEGVVGAQIEALKAARTEGDFLTASETAKRLTKEFAGLPAGDEAKSIGAEISKDSDAKRVMKGQIAVRKIKQTEVKRSKDAAELAKKLERLESKFEGTIVAREASEYRARLEAMMERG